MVDTLGLKFPDIQHTKIFIHSGINLNTYYILKSWDMSIFKLIKAAHIVFIIILYYILVFFHVYGIMQRGQIYVDFCFG
jgi:hypothetical protein